MIESRWCVCRPVLEQDLDLVYQLLLQPSVNARLRFRSRAPSLSEFAAHAWDDILTQWMVLDHQRRFVGLVAISGADFVDGFAWISVARDTARRDMRASAVFVDGICAVMGYVFGHWPLRMLHAEFTESSLAEVESGAGRFFVIEGRLEARRFVDGRYEDVLIATISRERWSETVLPAWNRLRFRPEEGPRAIHVSDVDAQSGQ